MGTTSIDGEWLKLAESFSNNQKEIFLALCHNGTSDVDMEIHGEARCCSVEAKFRTANSRPYRFLGFLEKFYKGMLDISQRFCFNDVGYELFLLSDENSLENTVKLLRDLPIARFENIIVEKDAMKRKRKVPSEENHVFAMNLAFAWLLSVSTNEEIHSRSVFYCEHTQRHMSLRDSWNDIQARGFGLWELIFLFSRRTTHSFCSIVAISLCTMAHLKIFTAKWAKWRYENNAIEGFGNMFKLLCGDVSRKVHDRESGRLRIDTYANLYFRDLGNQIKQRHSITGDRFDAERAEDASWYGNEIKRCASEISEYKGEAKLYITYLDIVAALLNDDTRVGEETLANQKQFLVHAKIPGNIHPRYLDFNHIYSYCGTRMPIMNSHDFSHGTMSRILTEVKNGKYFQLLAFIQYIVESMALIVFTSNVAKFDSMQLSGPISFENNSITAKKGSQALLMKTFASMDERVGFTEFWNEISEKTVDTYAASNSDVCPFITLINLTQSFCLNFVEKISTEYEGVAIHFEKDKVLRGIVMCNTNLTEVLLELEKSRKQTPTPDVVEKICFNMEKMLMILALVPCNAAAFTLSLHIERQIRPAVVSNRPYFCNLIAETFVHSIQRNGAREYGKTTECLFRTIMRISETSPEFALPNRADPRHPDNRATIIKRVAFLSVLPSLKYFTDFFPTDNGEPGSRRWVCDYHIQLNYADLRSSFEELDHLLRLFALCIILPSQYITPDHHSTITSIQRWKCKGDFQNIMKGFDAGIPEEFGPIIQNLGDRQNKIFSFVYGRMMSLIRDILLADSYKNGATFNAKIREMAAYGQFSFMLCRGFMLVPRLKRWIKNSAKLGLMIMEIHQNYIFSHIEKVLPVDCT